jgi:hypothetical protein
MIAFLHKIRQWLEIALVILIAAFLVYHFILKPSPTITLPGGQVINMDTTSFNNAVKQMLKKQQESNQKVDDLRGEIFQLQNSMQMAIQQASKETDIRKSVQGMLDSWGEP